MLTSLPPPSQPRTRRRRRKRRRKRGGCEKRGREYSHAPVKGKSEQCHDEHTLYDARKRGEDDGDDYNDDQEFFAEFRLLFSRVLPLGGHTRAQGIDDVRKKESERETRRTTALVWWFVCT
uniref:Uncharacterized protein n=1 Tax=Trichogramma kaykai TaxID=54128 RepID=A0ABD2VX71_9HYME